MKSILEEKEKPKRAQEFPVLKKWVGEGHEFVVLFMDRCKAVVVDVGDSYYRLGEFDVDWVGCHDKDWVDYDGRVILEND